ncbi:MAG: HisA/HisF-related TIM barrel protein [Spirochaetia bacterium]|jgi:phosphoribosylformimino-5-aminoimidazole carboxamide ribotide isomerase
MLLVPAIDLRAGRCVRLVRGSFSDSTEYSQDPVAVALGFAEQGARWIHIVDLDAAEGKGADNLPVIERIRRAVSCRVQVGGGVRTAAQAERLFGLGVERIVLGTMIVRSPEEVSEWIGRWERKFAGGIDAQDGRVRISGWTEEAGRADTEVAAALPGLGVRWLVYTSISRDGTLAGPDIERTSAAARASGLPTILSGGIGSERDVDVVAEKGDPLVVGVILGKSLYESRVDLGRLIRRYPQESATAWDS